MYRMFLDADAFDQTICWDLSGLGDSAGYGSYDDDIYSEIDPGTRVFDKSCTDCPCAPSLSPSIAQTGEPTAPSTAPTPAPSTASTSPPSLSPTATPNTAPTPATSSPTPAIPAPTPATSSPTSATPAPTSMTPSPTSMTPSPTSATPSPTVASTPAPTQAPTEDLDSSTFISTTLTMESNPDILACSDALQNAFIESAETAICDAAGLLDRNGTCRSFASTTLVVGGEGVDCGALSTSSTRRLHTLSQRRRLDVTAEYMSTLTVSQADAEEAGLDTETDYASTITNSIATSLQDAADDGATSEFLQSFESALVDEVNAAGGEIEGFSSSNATDFSETASVTSYRVDSEVEEDDESADESADESDGLGGGAIAGIVVGAVVGVALAGFAAFFGINHMK